MQYLAVWNIKKNFLKTEIFHEIFQTQKKHVFYISNIGGLTHGRT